MKGVQPTKQVARLLLQRTSSGLQHATKPMPLLQSWSTSRTRVFTRKLSSATAGASDAKAAGDAATKKSPAGESTGNVFLDNLGTIFLSAIGLIIGSLVRSSYGTSNRNKIRDVLEESAALDPLEIDDLRIANSELTVPVFRDIMKELTERFTDHQSVTYSDFIAAVRRTMIAMKGDNFTIELGHLLDRVVLGSLKKHGHTSDEPQPLAFWLTVLSLALSTPAVERIQILYEVLQEVGDRDNSTVTVANVQEIVGYLQDTCQLVPDTQVTMTDRKYPVQQYECGVAKQLVNWEGSEEDEIDVDAFAQILRSKSCCAWGECYSVKRHV
jgi:hypothetical protein